LVASQPEFGTSKIAKGVDANDLLTFLAKNGFKLEVSNGSHTSVSHPSIPNSNTTYTIVGHQNQVHKNNWKHTMQCMAALGCTLDETALKKAVSKKKKII